MLDCERFRHHRTDTAGTGKSREGHQQVAEQWEQQFHAEWNSNRRSTVSKSALRLTVLSKSAIRHTHAQVAGWLRTLRRRFQQRCTSVKDAGADPRPRRTWGKRPAVRR